MLLNSIFRKLMLEMANSRKDHRQTVFVCRRDNFFVSDRTAGLNDRRNAVFRGFVHAVAEREKSIRSKHGIF